jgi:nucleotide-binding universal stress UspA family protein
MSQPAAKALAGSGLVRVIVGTDFSTGARAALGRAALLPLGWGAEVTLVHVESPHGRGRGRGAGEGSRQLAEEARWLERRLAREGRSDVGVRSMLDAGATFERLLARARLARAQLIVLGRHGGGIRSLLVGPTAERVTRGRVAPVLIVGRPPKQAYAQPLVALDPEAEGAPRLLRFALRVLDPGVKRVEVVSAYRVLLERRIRRVGASAAEIRELRRAEARRTLRLLERALADAGPLPVPIVRRVLHGDAREVILERAGRSGADLLVLRTNARRGLARFLLGSVAVEVMRSAKCDVMLVPKNGG